MGLDSMRQAPHLALQRSGVIPGRGVTKRQEATEGDGLGIRRLHRNRNLSVSETPVGMTWRAVTSRGARVSGTTKLCDHWATLVTPMRSQHSPRACLVHPPDHFVVRPVRHQQAW